MGISRGYLSMSPFVMVYICGDEGLEAEEYTDNQGQILTIKNLRTVIFAEGTRKR
jgi:hypothetical protein